LPDAHGPAVYDASSPEEICGFYRDHIESDPGYEKEKEHVVVICFNCRLEITGWHMVSIGSLFQSTCHPREVLRPVIVKSAYAFALCHNHPSGDPRPSPPDRTLTEQINKAANIIGIEMLDHVIIGDTAAKRAACYSFAARDICAPAGKLGGVA
jgi:DNA repair protein RadC